MPKNPTVKSAAPSQGSPFDKTAQHAAKRAAILSEAAKLFNSKGARTTTLADVAATLGLTKTSLYYYVKTKEDLIYQCYTATLEGVLNTLSEIEQAHISASNRIRAHINAHFDAIRSAKEGRGHHVAALLEIASLKEQRRTEIEQGYIAMFKKLREFIQQGIDAGEFRPVRTTTSTRALIGALDWSFYWLEPVPNEEIPALAEAAASIILSGVAAAPYSYTKLPEHRAPAPPAQPGFDRDAQNRLKQEAFYKAGTRFFNRKGFSGTSLDEIAEFLNVSKGAFYYHINSKDELLYRCYDYSLDQIEAVYAPIVARNDQGLNKVVSTCHQLFGLQLSEAGPLVRYNTITALTEEHRKPILRRTINTNRMMRHFLEQGIDDQTIRPINTLVAENLITGALNAAMELRAWRPIDNIHDTAIDYFDTLINGLLTKQEP